MKFGGIASGTGSDDVPNILKATIGLPLQLVTGYRALPKFAWPLTAVKFRGQYFVGVTNRPGARKWRVAT